MAAIQSNIAKPGLLVGRDTHLGQLRQCLGRALNGTRGLTLLAGEPGIGKTTLVEYFIQEATAPNGAILARGQCVEHYGAGEPYLPLLEAIARLCREEPHGEQVREALRTHAPSWLAQLPALCPKEELAELQVRIQGSTKDRMLREMADALDAIATDRTVVVVLEDLHWSDVSTVNWLSYFARRPDPARLLVLGTYRPSDVLKQGHPIKQVIQELQARDQCRVLRLDLLRESEVHDYLENRLGAGSVPAALSQALHHRTGGNPLFLVSTVDLLGQRGLLEGSAPKAIDEATLRQIDEAIPESLRRLIETRIEGLGPLGQEVLEAGAVIGMEFSAAGVAGGLAKDVNDIEQCCEELVRTGQFIRNIGLAEWPDGTVSSRFEFVHTLYQSVLRDRIPQARRVRLHRAIGARKEAAYGARAAEIVTELMNHFEAGRDYARAANYCHLAGSLAISLHAHREAIRHFTKGLALLQTLPESPDRLDQELRLKLSLGAPLAAIKGYASPEVGDAFVSAYELSRQSNAPSKRVGALWGVFGYYLTRAELAKARELARQCDAEVGEDGPDSAFVRASFMMSQVAFHTGDFATAEFHARRAVERHDFDDAGGRDLHTIQDVGVSALLYQASSLWFLGFIPEAREVSERAMTTADRLGLPVSMIWARLQSADLYRFARNREVVYERTKAALDLASEQGLRYWVLIAGILHAWAFETIDDAHGGIQGARRNFDIFRAMGAELGRSSYLCILAETCQRAGLLDDALAAVDEGLAAVEDNRECVLESELWRVKAELMTARDPNAGFDQVELCYERALTVSQAQGARFFQLRAAASFARRLLERGDPERAKSLLEPIYPWFAGLTGLQDVEDAANILAECGVDLAQIKPVEKQLPAHPAQSAPKSPPATQSASESPPRALRREGEYWTVTFDGAMARIKDTRGMHYLALLLAQPGREIHAVQLVHGGKISGRETRQTQEEASDVLDARAKTEYKRRLEQLREELDEANTFNDHAKAAAIEEEIAFLSGELARGLGLAGKSRKTVTNDERARVNVTRAIKSAIQRLRTHHPLLASHLEEAINTGMHCVYRPTNDGSGPVEWDIQT